MHAQLLKKNLAQNFSYANVDNGRFRKSKYSILWRKFYVKSWPKL